jgi:hypothetical protein
MTRIAALLALLAMPALADTPCPTVSNGVNILSVNIVGAPLPVAFAGLDLETGYLTVTFVNRSSQMFIGVPQGLVQGFQTQWASISNFPQALMQEKSTCPLLQETAQVKPIWTR